MSKAGLEAKAVLPRGLVRAAQYVRMSTEHQKYSTANQADVIRRYADQRGIEIIRTYADEGRSGLTLKDRDGLRSLIADVFSGEAEFSVILVYDVSRWGRFQDVDEAAHLEYLCTSAGKTIHYCAETFTNDGSIGATIFKSIKRAMAAEYSRELSAKTFAGQCRIASLGFHSGGPAPIGLRRILVDENRRVKGELQPGQYKNLQSDRIILAPGPPEEIATVRRIFRLFVKGKNESQIALSLNREGRLTHLGRPWLRGTVRKVLTNEKYIGNVVRNKTSFKLRKKRISNPPEMVLRAVGAFPAIVERKLFEKARKIIDERVRRLTDDEMLDQLKGLWKKAGTLSYRLINDTEGLHGGKQYAYRFGSLDRVYKRLGFEPTRDLSFVESNRGLRRLRTEIVGHLTADIQGREGIAAYSPETGLLTINEEITANVVIVRYINRVEQSSRWEIFPAHHRADLTILVRMARGNIDVLDYYILPESELGLIDRPLFERNGLRIDAYRFDTLDPFLDLATRVKVVKGKGEASDYGRPKASWRLSARESSKASEIVGQRRTIPRFGQDSDLENKPRQRSAKLLRVHRREIDRQRRLVRKAEIDQSRLSDAVDAFSSLFGDDHFITLLRAEAITTMPWPLAEQMRGRSWL